MDKDSKVLKEAYVTEVQDSGPPEITNPVWSYDAMTGKYTAEASELGRLSDAKDPWGIPLTYYLDKTVPHRNEDEVLYWIIQATSPNKKQVVLVVYND